MAKQDTRKRIRGRDLGLHEDPPADLPVVIADIGEGMIVWSRKGRLHRVRYGLQVREYKQDGSDPVYAQLAASEEFGHNVRHFAECEGLMND